MNSIMSIENYVIGEVALKLDITDNVIVDISKEDIEKIYKENGLIPKNDSGLENNDYADGEIVFKFEKGTENLSEVLICPNYIAYNDKEYNGDFVNIKEFMTIEEIKETKIYNDSLKALRDVRKENTDIKVKKEKLLNKYKEKSILNNVISSLILRKDDQDYLESFNQLYEDLNKEIRYLRLNIIKEYGELYLYSKTIEDIENICYNKEEEIYKSLEDIENEMNNLSDRIDEISDQLYTKIITLGLIEDIENAYIHSISDNREEK